jgi:pyroglutamyl-peptidase
MIDAVTAKGICCEVSHDAGAFVCNRLFYSMLEHNRGEVPTGFVHVPYIKEQGHADKPFMELDDIHHGVEAIIETLI